MKIVTFDPQECLIFDMYFGIPVQIGIHRGPLGQDGKGILAISG